MNLKQTTKKHHLGEHNEKLKVTPTQIQEYYKHNPPQLPSNPHRRQYKIITQKGQAQKIHRQIHKPQELQKILTQQAPVAAYYTQSQFIAPEQVNSKKNDRPGYSYADNLFLRSEYILDFDKQHAELQNIKHTIKTLKTQLALTNKDLELRQTGNGYHLLFTTFTEKMCKPPHQIPNPRNRENHHKQIKQNLTKHLNKQGCRFDEPISIDTRRIIRIPNTLHQNGTIITKISIKQFMNSNSHPPRKTVNQQRPRQVE